MRQQYCSRMEFVLARGKMELRSSKSNLLSTKILLNEDTQCLTFRRGSNGSKNPPTVASGCDSFPLMSAPALIGGRCVWHLLTRHLTFPLSFLSLLRMEHPLCLRFSFLIQSARTRRKHCGAGTVKAQFSFLPTIRHITRCSWSDVIPVVRSP